VSATLPPTMRAVRLTDFDRPDNLELRVVPVPEPGAGEVLVRVGACGVCGRDRVDRRGGYPGMRLPVTLGHEIAGTVVARGAGVDDLAVGDRVASLQSAPCGTCSECRVDRTNRCREPLTFGHKLDGGYAEYVAAPARAWVRLPDGVPDEVGAMLACAVGTCLRALRDRAGLRAGETVAITGAGGGLGLQAIQVARMLGGRTIGVTTSADKEEAIRAAGAVEVVVAEGGQLARRVRELTEGVGADVVLELVGAPLLEASLRALRGGGRLVLVGNIRAERVEINPGLIIVRELAVLGSAMETRADLEETVALAATGRLAPVVGHRFPLERALDAHRLLEARRSVGRVVLVP
jgi:acryloyl-coenzyme A reductase